VGTHLLHKLDEDCFLLVAVVGVALDSAIVVVAEKKTEKVVVFDRVFVAVAEDDDVFEAVLQPRTCQAFRQVGLSLLLK